MILILKELTTEIPLDGCIFFVFVSCPGIKIRFVNFAQKTQSKWFKGTRTTTASDNNLQMMALGKEEAKHKRQRGEPLLQTKIDKKKVSRSGSEEEDEREACSEMENEATQ